MNCHECQELLHARLDGAGIPASADLESHLAGCQACRSDHAAAGLLMGALKRLPRAEPRLNLADHIVSAVLQDRVQRRLKMRRRVLVTMALAAAILLMAWAGNLWLPNSRPDKPAPEHPPLAEKKAEEPTPPVRDNLMVGPPAPLAQSMDEAREAMLALTGRLAGETKGQAKMLIAAAPTDVAALTESVRNFSEQQSPMEDDIQLDPAADSLRQAGQGVSQGLQTVTGNARRAFNFFVRDLPVLE